ncbi:hypothetical protein, partial [Salmonella enterica]
HIADKCVAEAAQVREYLTSRGIADKVIDKAISRKTLGFNNYVSPSRPSGEVGHGGPAAAFIIRDQHTDQVRAVDLRYLDPDINGGVKT